VGVPARIICQEKSRSQKRDLGHPLKVWRSQVYFRQRSHGPLGPPKVMKNGFSSATALPVSTGLPFVISTEAKRSGEISVWMLFLGNVFRQSEA
jgi:hypothetical protein